MIQSTLPQLIYVLLILKSTALENEDTNNTSLNYNQNKIVILNQIEEQINEMMNGKVNFTLIMDDPASKSYLQVSQN